MSRNETSPKTWGGGNVDNDGIPRVSSDLVAIRQVDLELGQGGEEAEEAGQLQARGGRRRASSMP